jgi:hypothetical protein
MVPIPATRDSTVASNIAGLNKGGLVRHGLPRTSRRESSMRTVLTCLTLGALPLAGATAATAAPRLDGVVR